MILNRHEKTLRTYVDADVICVKANTKPEAKKEIGYVKFHLMVKVRCRNLSSIVKWPDGDVAAGTRKGSYALYKQSRLKGDTLHEVIRAQANDDQTLYNTSFISTTSASTSTFISTVSSQTSGQTISLRASQAKGVIVELHTVYARDRIQRAQLVFVDD
jgi:D-mannonate dehydratase